MWLLLEGERAKHQYLKNILTRNRDAIDRKVISLFPVLKGLTTKNLLPESI
jgi:hypothetical protein